MFQVFRSFFAEGSYSGGILVTVDATGYITPCGATGYAVGTIEAYLGNTDSQFDSGVTSTGLPVNVRLFGPTRQVSVTGSSPTGFSPGTLLYQAAGGQASPTGTVAIGLALTASSANGDNVEIAEIGIGHS
jgi:hypothetical protein